MLRLFLIFILIGLNQTLTAQFKDDFSSSELSQWKGDISSFTVNDDQRLQLNAAEGGKSLIYTTTEFSDSLSWSIDVELKFGASGSNMLEIWLVADDLTADSPTGYKLEIGETGSNDAIKFIWVDQGDESIIAAGDMGQVAVPFSLSITISKDAADQWILTTGTPTELFGAEAFTAYFEDSFLPRSGDFGMNCTYTNTRVTAFYFDNIELRELLPDSEAPILVSATVENASKINLLFNEPIAEASLSTANYNFGGAMTSVADATLVADNLVCLNLVNPLPSGMTTVLTVSDLEDALGNKMTATDIELQVTESPTRGDLVINEILYNPNTGNVSDFVELKNISDKFLSLDELYLGRANSTAADVQIPDGYILKPNDIIAFGDDAVEITDTYQPIATANIVELNITNYVNGEGNVWLRNKTSGDFVTVDSLDYFDDWHSPLLTTSNRKGISLERLSGTADTNDPSNWLSAAGANNFATPGYENSQVSGGITGDEVIEIENKVFSPDGDGYKDFTRLNFQLDKPGYLGNVAIYDDHGRLETYIAENKSLGTRGSFIWQGLKGDGTVAPIGMYIFYYDLFHPDGDVISGKKVCVLAKLLN